MKNEILINKEKTVKDALKQLDRAATKTLIVVKENNGLIGAISDGDVRRFILKGGEINHPIEGVYNKTPLYFIEGDYTTNDVKKAMLMKGIELVPIIDKNGSVVDCLTWATVFSDEKADIIFKSLDVPVVIMAGGVGSRLEPFTKVFPKPLFPIGEQTITELIINEFKKYGITNYYLTLNYKSKMIEAYFDSVDKNYDIKYIKENEFMGTAGSLSLLKGKVSGTFIVSNCDVIVKADYADVVSLHRSNKAAITVLSSIKHYKIPYGVVSFGKGGDIIEISEKPEYTLTINTGVYVIDAALLDMIPEGSKMDMNELIAAAIKANKKVVTYPVNESNYIDIGQWKEYKESLDRLKL